jgi:uncharacterized protein (TIGR01244 family)
MRTQSYLTRAVGAGIAIAMFATTASAQVQKSTVPGITNFSKVETTIACGGATSAAAVPELKKMGYVSIINLRLPSEQGAEVDAEMAAAKANSINYIALPFNTASPDPAVVDKFIAAVTTPANQPAFIHCASANRVGALWAVKRMLVDGWDEEKAMTEAAAIGLSNPALKTFALDYVKTHPKR